MQLSRNLSLKEAIKSNTATNLGIKNIPEDWEIRNLMAVADNIFQPVRDHFGVPIGITSGYRSKELNKAIGGSKYSQHMIGEALDIDADVYGGVTNSEIFNYIKDNLVWDQMIWEFGNDEEPDWVHVSYKENGLNRKQIKRAYKEAGKTVYKTM